MSSFKEAFQEFGELDDVVYDIDNKDDLDRLKKSLDRKGWWPLRKKLSAAAKP